MRLNLPAFHEGLTIEHNVEDGLVWMNKRLLGNRVRIDSSSRTGAEVEVWILAKAGEGFLGLKGERVVIGGTSWIIPLICLQGCRGTSARAYEPYQGSRKG
jgi:hypothetical protein